MMILPGPQILLMYFFIQTTKTCSPIIVCIVCHNADGILNAKVLLIEKEEGGEDCSDSLTSSKRLLFSRDAHSPNRPLSVSHTSVSSSCTSFQNTLLHEFSPLIILLPSYGAVHGVLLFHFSSGHVVLLPSWQALI